MKNLKIIAASIFFICSCSTQNNSENSHEHEATDTQDTTKTTDSDSSSINPNDTNTGSNQSNEDTGTTDDITNEDTQENTDSATIEEDAHKGPFEKNKYLSDLCEEDGSINGWGPIEKDLSNGEEEASDGGPLILGGTVYSKGLGVHAPSMISYNLDRNCSIFSADLGIDEEMKTAGSVIFEVYGDNELLYKSDLIRGRDEIVSIEIDILNENELRLEVTDGGDHNGSDHANWADARLICNNTPLPKCPLEPTPIPQIPGYQLSWSDEFDIEGRPNSDNWGYESGYVRNNEWQYYQEDNAFVQAGFLIIQGRREPAPEGNYTSSSLRTMNNNWTPKQSFLYGIIEMRARIVAEPGLWPAFWTLGVGGGDWPSNGEIDIMEYYNNRIHANVASGTNQAWTPRWDGSSREISSFGVRDWDSKFHIWTMEWDSEKIVLKVDGIQMNEVYLNDMLNPNGVSPFRAPHYILINLAIGGDAGGNASNTHFPSHYIIDYVRVYQQQ